MGGRGTFAAGNPVPYTWETVGKIGDIKVLKGTVGQHKLPEEAHSSSAYARLNPDGSLRELRFYDKKHRLRLEIAKHPEKNVDPSNKPVLHYHIYKVDGSGPWHGRAQSLTPSMRKRYGKLFGRIWK